MTFDERVVVARVERLTLRELRLWVREGWVRPVHSLAGPMFDELDIARIRLLCDLKKDMSLSTDALPVVLTLIDHLHEARRELRYLSDALEEQPSDIRSAVIRTYRARQNQESGEGSDD